MSNFLFHIAEGTDVKKLRNYNVRPYITFVMVNTKQTNKEKATTKNPKENQSPITVKGINS